MAQPTRKQIMQYGRAVARQTGVPESYFLALIATESAFNPQARSPAGAIGLGQLMPGTARGLGVNPNNWQQNLRGSARYLKQQLDRFGRIDLALSAYNSGPGGSESKGRVEGFKETQGYVRRVAELEKQYRAMGFDVKGGPIGEAVSTRDMEASQEQAQQVFDAKFPASGAYLDALKRSGSGGQMLARNVESRPSLPVFRAPPVEPTATASAGAPAAFTAPQAGGEWGGAMNFGRSLIGDFGPLKVVSEKRDRKSTASGGVSDHWTGSKNAYAWDLSDGSHPTKNMDRKAAQILGSLGIKYKGGPVVVTKTVGNYRVQVLYRTNVGGNHHNHIHVGVRRIK